LFEFLSNDEFKFVKSVERVGMQSWGWCALRAHGGLRPRPTFLGGCARFV